MLKLKVSILKNNLAIIILNMLYVEVFYVFFKLDKESISFALMHSLLASILIIQLSNILTRRKELSLGYLMSYVLCMYFQFSTMKYCRVGTFAGFSKDNEVRFVGTWIVFGVLFGVNIFQGIHKRNNYKKNDYNKKPSGFILWAWLISIALLIYFFIINDYDNSIYTNLNYKEQSIILTISISILVCIGVYLAVMYLNVHRLITYIPLVIVIISFSYGSLRSGSRASFFAYSLLILFMLVEVGIVSTKWFIVAQIFSPWILVLFTWMAFGVSGRYTTDLQRVVAMNIAYRFDLSDFAMMIINNTSWKRFNITEIVAGFFNCIPSVISTEYKGFSAYYTILREASLNSAVDYSDTFFSMGATVGGIWGMMVIIPLFYVVYEFIEVYLKKKGVKGILIKLICIMTLTRIETEWTSFIPQIRNMILEIIVVVIAYRIIAANYLLKGTEI